MLGILLAVAMGAQTAQPPKVERVLRSFEPTVELSTDPMILAIAAPVDDAIKAERAAQALLSPAATDSERLIRMARVDQAGRRVWLRTDIHNLPPAQRQAAADAMATLIYRMDTANQAELLKLLPPEGWFYKSRYGPAASNAAFLIIQHSNVELWRRFVPVLEPLVAKGEVDGPDYALMYDRLAINEGRPQRYGSQMTCKAGRFVVDTLEAPETVDQRRAAIGLTQPLAEYVKRFADYPPCQGG